MKKLPYIFLSVILVLCACSTEAPPIGSSISNRDSMPVLAVNGVSKMISDSGVVRYKLLAEEWLIYDRTNPPRQDFLKGIFLMRLNDKFDVDLFISADTAFCYDNTLWELRSRVYINDLSRETKFFTDELFWDSRRHEMYSNQYMHIITPDRELEGNSFTSNENLTRYTINWARGTMPIKEEQKPTATSPNPGTDSLATDTLPAVRKAPQAQRKSVW